MPRGRPVLQFFDESNQGSVREHIVDHLDAPTPTQTATPSDTPSPTAALTPTPAGPTVEVNNLECSGEQTSLASYSYKVTGEVHANRDIADVQVSFGKNSFVQVGSGNWIYLAYPGTYVNLGLMTAGESKSFKLSFWSFF